MRVALLHNTSAGSEDHTDAELVELIRRAGHEVAHVVDGVSKLAAALQDSPCDLVVVAGGDGTVGRAACELSGWQVPLSILALGTANNTARALGLPRGAKRLLKSWKHARRVPFDLGFLDDGGLRQRFSEGVGWGVFAQTIASSKQEAPCRSPRKQLKHDRKLFRRSVEQAAPKFYRVEVDGRDRSGEYLLLEVLNVPLIGPRLQLSPASDPGDGKLEVVMARETDRALLAELTRTGTLTPGHLPCERAERVRIVASDGMLHRDGGLARQAPGLRSFELWVEPKAIDYLR